MTITLYIIGGVFVGLVIGLTIAEIISLIVEEVKKRRKK